MPLPPFASQRTASRCNFRPLILPLALFVFFGLWFLRSCYTGTIKHGAPLVEQYVEYGHGDGGRKLVHIPFETVS